VEVREEMKTVLFCSMMIVVSFVMGKGVSTITGRKEKAARRDASSPGRTFLPVVGRRFLCMAGIAYFKEWEAFGFSESASSQRR
jgi:hypothetical protein